MRFVDIHSHILPSVDDGAKNIEESLKLLSALQEQGVTDVFLTPHFYPHIMSGEDFLEARAKSYKMLTDAVLGKELPNLYLGCELYYFDRMGAVGDIKPFTLGDSHYLLLELEMAAVSDIVIETLEGICEMGYIPIFAHIERYLGCRGIKRILKLIKDGKCMAQVNAAAILSFGNKKIFKLIKKGYIHIIGSDTHSLEERPPYMDEALRKIAQNCGEEQRDILIENSHKLWEKIFGEQDEK